jgi:hypothetical protein
MQTRGIRALSLVLLSLSFFGGVALAQEPATVPTRPAAGYDLQREGTVVGTVVSYTQASTTPPLGAHVILKTSSGNLDVHLGDPRLLQANHFDIQTGDTLRIVGEAVNFGKGTQFVARVVQNGTQALQVRSIRGVPLSYAAPRNESSNSSNSKQGGIL